MTNQSPLNGQQIIIRQEVIFPVGWGPQTFPTHSAIPTHAAPCGPCGGTPPSAPSQVDSNPAPVQILNYYLTRPYYDTPCTSTPNGLVRVEGHSDYNGFGAVKICAKCYRTSELITQPPASPPMDATCIAASGSGATLNVNWYINDVRIAASGVLNTVVAWSQFLGSPTWQRSLLSFVPCVESGSGFSVPIPATSTEPHAEVPPPREFLLTPPAATGCIRLIYDDFCSTPEQSVWTPADQSASRWILKACRYGDRLIGVLSDRSDGNFSVAWITDNFRLNSRNELGREGMSHSVAVVHPV